MLGQQSIDEFITKSTSILRYVSYTREEKAKMQRFTSSKHIFIKETRI